MQIRHIFRHPYHVLSQHEEESSLKGAKQKIQLDSTSILLQETTALSPNQELSIVQNTCP